MINSWKNNLLSLPDSIFFDIMRNYLGDLKTPFNKHDLIRSLTSLVSKQEVRSRIFSLIDNDDSRLLTAIALLDSSGIEELYEFTKQYYSFLELHNRIANLQERLLICIEYPDQNSRPGKKLIKLNPVFEDDLTGGYLDNHRIFSTLSIDESSSAPLLNEQFIAAFISFAMNNGGIFTAGGIARKKAEAAWMNIFRIQHEDKDSPIFTYLTEVCRKLGFISADSHSFAVKLDQISNFGQYPADDRNIMLAAAAVSSFHPEQGQSFETASKLMFHLFKSLPNGSRLHENDLKSFFYLIRRSTCKTYPDAAEFTDDLITEALSYYGYLIKEDDFRLFSHGRNLDRGEKLKIQSNFEISAPAGFSLAEEIHAACCCEIKNYDITRTYELTKPAFAAALDAGLQSEDIEKELIESASGSIPQNIGFSMKAWAREYESIGLNYGIVMTVSKERLPLIEHSPGLKEFFTANPAPGVFILEAARETEWRKAFAEAGFDMLPTTPSPTIKESLPPSSAQLTSYGDCVENWTGRFEASSEIIIEEISAKIKKLSMSAESKQKLEARAHKKLILTDSQLTVSNRPEERGEAGGLDHRAKIRLTERALELDNLLEITTAKEFDLEKRLVKPLKLVKSESEIQGKPPVFLVEGIELPEEQELRIPITRISYLRMLKSSLFTP